MRTALLVVVLSLLLAAVGPATATTHAGTVPVPTDAPVAGSAAGQPACEFPVTETDATGTEVTVESEPGRITVLGPSAAQTLWEIGGRDRVVAAPHQFAGYLDGIEETTDVSGTGQNYVSTERVVNTTPDLVLAPNVITDDTVSKLREAGLTVYKFRAATSIDDVYAKTTLTGRLVDECENASETVAWMQERIGAIEDAVADEERPRVLISLGGGFSAGNGTFIHEVLTVAGVANVAERAGVSGYAELSAETVVAQDPEWIIENGPFATYPKNEAYNATTAVQEGQVFTIDPNHASQPAPRIVYAIENVTKVVHLEAYDEAMASLEAAQTTPTTGSTPTDETTTDSTTAAETTAEPTAEPGTTAGPTATTGEATASGGQPGFGAGVAVLAMLAAGLVASRRR